MDARSGAATWSCKTCATNCFYVAMFFCNYAIFFVAVVWTVLILCAWRITCVGGCALVKLCECACERVCVCVQCCKWR